MLLYLRSQEFSFYISKCLNLAYEKKESLSMIEREIAKKIPKRSQYLLAFEKMVEDVIHILLPERHITMHVDL